MLTKEEIYITDEIYQRSKVFTEEREFDLFILLETPQSSPEMYWVMLTLEEEQFENVNFMVSVTEQKYDFILNLYYHMMYLTQDYEMTGLPYYCAMELAQKDIEELLTVYNQKEVDFYEIRRINPSLFLDEYN